jgi:hypothetical protein
VFSDVGVVEDGTQTTIYGTCLDRSLKVVAESVLVDSSPSAQLIGYLAISPMTRSMFGGVSEPNRPGPILVYGLHPLVSDSTEVQAHAGPVTRLRLSPDEQHLFSVGADGALCIFEVKDREHRTLRRDKEPLLPVSQEIIVTRHEIDDLASSIETLSNQLTDLTGATSSMPQQTKLAAKDTAIERLKG